MQMSSYHFFNKMIYYLSLLSVSYIPYHFLTTLTLQADFHFTRMAFFIKIPISHKIIRIANIDNTYIDDFKNNDHYSMC